MRATAAKDSRSPGANTEKEVEKEKVTRWHCFPPESLNMCNRKSFPIQTMARVGREKETISKLESKRCSLDPTQNISSIDDRFSSQQTVQVVHPKPQAQRQAARKKNAGIQDHLSH